jgi:SAM-dependent methyltransferase
MVSRRTARDRAAFVLPLLRDGMRALDVGCGPGSITLGLAASVGPTGRVVGVDRQPSQIDLATRAAESSAKRILEAASSDPSMQDAAMAASRWASSGVVGSAGRTSLPVFATRVRRFGKARTGRSTQRLARANRANLDGTHHALRSRVSSDWVQTVTGHTFNPLVLDAIERVLTGGRPRARRRSGRATPVSSSGRSATTPRGSGRSIRNSISGRPTRPSRNPYVSC